jgi:hypothetical protein
MDIVGTDEITVRDGRTAPAGHRHAIGRDGRALCRAARARFTWPGVTWSDAAEQACPLCVQVRRAQQVFTAPAHEAYPQAPVQAPATGYAPTPVDAPAPVYASAAAYAPVAAQSVVADPLFAEPTDSVA